MTPPATVQSSERHRTPRTPHRRSALHTMRPRRRQDESTPPASPMSTAEAGTRAHGASATAPSFAHEQGHEHEHKQPRGDWRWRGEKTGEGQGRGRGGANGGGWDRREGGRRGGGRKEERRKVGSVDPSPKTHPQLMRRESRLLRLSLSLHAPAPSTHVGEEGVHEEREGSAAHVERERVGEPQYGVPRGREEAVGAHGGGDPLPRPC
ncbi:hypothetical protein DFH09DRAFT_1430926 [Mycena vulgaris]|nr:hypothetical protein DFH09DRAFT_1430926 [Mycena vulgaris]